MKSDPEKELRELSREVIHCRKCPRLVHYRQQVAREKRAAFRDWQYWGRPVPGFGDSRAELLVLGLAPAAHGGNRTGRVFTGDRSGDFLYKMLYRAGFASQPTSRNREDGLRLYGAYVTAAVRCAPPANKPLPAEILNCRRYLESELELLRPKALLALGSIAFHAYLGMLKRGGAIKSAATYRFRHGAAYALPGNLPRLYAAYHPSQQNTFTGKLTEGMFLRVLRQIDHFLEQSRHLTSRTASSA